MMSVRIVRVLLILLLSLNLSSCSTFGFLFERLPWLSEWQASRMFDLSDTQEEEVEQVAKTMQVWLRTEGFPLLISDLQRYAQSWETAPNSNEIIDLFSSLELHSKRFLERLGAELAPVMLSLRSENLDYYATYVDEKSQDWFEHLVSSEDKQDARLERFEDWFGRLNDAQEEMLRQHIYLLDDELAIRYSNTAQWSNTLRTQVLAQNQQAIQSWLEQPSIWWSEDYASLRAENRLMIDRFLVELVPNLSDKQKRHALLELQQWIENLEEVVSNSA